MNLLTIKLNRKWKIDEGDIKNRKTKNDYFKLQRAVNGVSGTIDKKWKMVTCHLSLKLNNPSISAKHIGQVLNCFVVAKVLLIPFYYEAVKH